MLTSAAATAADLKNRIKLSRRRRLFTVYEDGSIKCFTSVPRPATAVAATATPAPFECHADVSLITIFLCPCPLSAVRTIISLRARGTDR